jgi:serine phosphatase RsbU (regulator of sigma subunit)
VIRWGCGELRYSAAAHPPRLLVRNGRVTQIEENGLMLAVFDFASYSTAVHRLEPDDRIVMYTEGVVEAFKRCRRFLRSRCIVRSADQNS